MGPNTVPPLRHSGLRISPTRARPVPFCRHGFLPEPLTADRFFVWCVPRRSAAFSCTTASQMRSVFTRPPKISSFRSRAPTFSLFELTMSIFISATSYQLPATSSVASSWKLEAGGWKLFLALLRAGGGGGLLRDGDLAGLLSLPYRFLLGRDRLADDQVGPRGARHRAADQHQ